MAEFISRSEKKRLYKQVGDLAAEIAGLSDRELKTFPGSPGIRKEIVAARGLKGGSRKRHIKYLAKMLQTEPVDEIYQFISNKKGSQLHAQKQFHLAERMRDTLINEALEVHQECMKERVSFEPHWQSDCLEDFTRQYPGLVEEDVRKLVYQYATTRSKQYYRELFRMIKAAVESKEREMASQA